DVDHRIADAQTSGQFEIETPARQNVAVGREPDRRFLAEVLDAQPAAGQFPDTDVVLGDIGVVDDAARDVVAFWSPAELQRPAVVLQLLPVALVADVTAKHGPSFGDKVTR